MARYTFITDADIDLQIKSELIAHIHNGDTTIIKKAEQAALKQVESKLQHRFDITKVLAITPQWDAATAYEIGEYVFDLDKFYIALSANANFQPKDNPTEWKEEDPRDRLLVSYLVDMVLYHMHSRISPTKVPELRRDRYKEAIEWLDMVRDQVETPDLDLLVDGLDDIPNGKTDYKEEYY